MSAYHKDGLKPGSTLAEYTIESVLGHGGFGITYLARDTVLGAHVAIKEYLPQEIAARDPRTGAVIPELSRDAIREYRWGLKNFLKEARALARFKHPNIVRVLRFLEANGTAYNVMEYEEGHTLAHQLKQTNQRIDEPSLLRIIMPILNGLQAVHEARLLHLDIKPENIYLRKDGSPILIDFGSARHAMSGHSSRAALTHGYAPVEQYPDQGALGPWSDVYAIGATMYRCITGKRPDGALDRYRALLDYKVDPLRPVSKGAKREYAPLLLECVQWAMQVHARDRPQTARHFQDRLLGRGRAVSSPVFGSLRKEAPAGNSTGTNGERALSPKIRVSSLGVVLASTVVLVGAILWSVRGDLPAVWRTLTALLPAAPDMKAPPLPAAETKTASTPAPATKTGPSPAPSTRAVSLPAGTGAESKPASTTLAISLPARFQTVLRGHSDWVQSLAFAPGGRRMASAGNDRVVRVWDLASGSAVGTLAHSHPVNAVAYSPNGRSLATAGVDGVVRLWDSSTGAQLQAFATAGYSLFGLAYSPDGQRLAAAGKDRTVYVWSLASGSQERALEGAQGEIHALAYAPDGRTIAAASADRAIRLWDVVRGTEEAVLAGHRDTILTLAFSPDGRWLASGDAQPAVRLWDRRNGTVRHTLTSFRHAVLALAFAPDGAWLAAASADHGVHLFETETGRPLQTLEGHDDYVQAVAVSRDGAFLASGSRDQSIRLWAVR